MTDHLRYTPGRYRDCRFCAGRGCPGCDFEAKRDFEKVASQCPIATFKFDSPLDMAALRSVFSDTVMQSHPLDKLVERISSIGEFLEDVRGDQ